MIILLLRIPIMYEILPTIKLVIRYIIIMFYMYLCWMVLQPYWLNTVKDLEGPVLSVLVGAPYGALTIILNAHFSDSINEKIEYNKKIVIKLTSRYIILFLLMYMSWYVMNPVWLNTVKNMNTMMLSILVGAPYGALSLVLKQHFKTKINTAGNNTSYS